MKIVLQLANVKQFGRILEALAPGLSRLSPADQQVALVALLHVTKASVSMCPVCARPRTDPPVHASNIAMALVCRCHPVDTGGSTDG